MEFYKLLSCYYDEIFPVSPQDMAFLKTRLKACRRILDLGCGSGNKTELLSEAGRTVVGVDSDQDMLSLARSRHSAVGLEYKLGDIVGLKAMFPEKSFDAVLCLGNTLVHLLTSEALADFFDGSARILPSGGLLVIQILNYDYLLSRQVKELPLIETDQLIFRRLYQAPAAENSKSGVESSEIGDWTAEGLCFHSILELKEPAPGPLEGAGPGDLQSPPTYESSVRLRPLFMADLDRYLESDFKDVQYFGGFDGSHWTKESFVTMLVATRR